MNANEEELQKRVEAGKVNDDLDAKAYQQVFSGLRQEPEFRLPTAFADRVVARIQLQQSKSLRREYFWLGFGIFLLVITFIVAIVLTEFTFDLGFLEGLSNFKGILIFGAGFILLLHWIDKRLLRGKHAV